MLLEIQGLHEPCGRVYYGEMSIRETLSCLGFREILFPHLKSIYALKNEMIKKGKADNKAISKYKYISTQSQWVRDHLQGLTNAKLFHTGMSLRSEFWSCKKWEYPCDNDYHFYCSAAGPAPYKSVQTAIKALSVVVKKYPNANLHIIGNFKNSKNWKHKSGYLTFVYNSIQNHKLETNIIFEGALTASEIVKVMMTCIGMIQTSFVESYSLAVAEAQAVGIPSIVSYAGAMSELAKDNETALFFSPGDYMACAGRMLDLIENRKLAESISEKSYQLAKDRNDDKTVLRRQLEIYSQILNSFLK